MGKYDSINFKPPESVAKAAEKVLSTESGKGTTRRG